MTNEERNANDLRNLLSAKRDEIAALEAQLKKANAEPIAELFKTAFLDSEDACDVLFDMTAKEINAVKEAIVKQFCESLRTEVDAVRQRDAERRATKKMQRVERERRKAMTGTINASIVADTDDGRNVVPVHITE